MRTFFFVLIGLIADIGMFRHHSLLIAGTIGGIFVARWISIQMSRWAWRDIGPSGRDAILWMLPRGLITVVLALEATEAAGKDLAFLPGLSFAVILATNLLVVFGSWRARKRQPNAAISIIAVPAEGTQESVATPATANNHHWILDATLLSLLAVGGVVLWYGNHPAATRPAIMQRWIQLLHHPL
jgi:Kef-type K+ transport system membrane component KefB